MPIPINQFITVTTEDNVVLRIGDRAFNYYDHEPGVIGEFDKYSPDSDKWFYFIQDNGKRKLLNGQRICSVRYAKFRGWMQ